MSRLERIIIESKEVHGHIVQNSSRLNVSMREEALLAPFYKDLCTGEANAESCNHIILCTDQLAPPPHTLSLDLNHAMKRKLWYNTVQYITLSEVCDAHYQQRLRRENKCN